MADLTLPSPDAESKEERRRAANREYCKRYNARHGDRRKAKALLADKDCRRQINRDYYQRHSEERKAKARVKYAENVEEARARVARWRVGNLDKIRISAAARNAKAPPNNLRSPEWKEKNRLRNKVYYEKNKARIAVKINLRRTRKGGAEGSYNHHDIAKIEKLQKGKCAICKTGLRKGNKELDHIMPLALGGENYPRNLQLLCEFCNRSKGAKHPIEFSQSRGLLL